MVNYGESELPYEPYSPIGGYPTVIKNNSIVNSKIVDNAITESKISDDSVSLMKIKGRKLFESYTSLFANSVLELWIDPKYKSEQENIIYVAKITGGRLYVRASIGGVATYLWQCHNVLPNVAEYKGYAIPIVCTTAGENMQVGDTIGYIVLSDLSVWEVSDSSRTRNDIKHLECI